MASVDRQVIHEIETRISNYPWGSEDGVARQNGEVAFAPRNCRDAISRKRTDVATIN
jgi:hypothetical protein